ncbi:MAG: mobilization protein, partial [Parabacteroides johnsonii]
NKEKGNELLNAAVGWATGKSKALKGEIEGLRHEISTHEETIEQLQGKIQTMQNDHHRELMKQEARHQSELNRKDAAAHTEETTRLKNRISWQNLIIGNLSFLLLKTSDIFRKAVNSVIRLAKDYYKPRFDAEQVSDIKSALDLFGDDKQSQRAAGDFLYITATRKGKLDNREQIKARREVDNVVEGHYEQQQKRGLSMRR